MASTAAPGARVNDLPGKPKKKEITSPGKEVEKYLSQKLHLYKISRSKRMSFFRNIFGTVTPVARPSAIGSVGEDDGQTERVRYDPKSAFRARWDLVMGAFIIYTCGILPLRVAFGDSEFGFFSFVDFCIDLCFIYDIYINFNTG